MSECDAGRKDVAGRPERHAMFGDVPERHHHREDQSAVEHTAGSGEREQFPGRAAELVEVDEQQHQLRADERRDDDVDAEVEHAIGIEAPALRAGHRQSEPEQVRRGQEDAVRIDGEWAELK